MFAESQYVSPPHTECDVHRVGAELVGGGVGGGVGSPVGGLVSRLVGGLVGRLVGGLVGGGVSSGLVGGGGVGGGVGQVRLLHAPHVPSTPSLLVHRQ